MKLTYEALLKDPSVVERITARARRDRAEALHRLIVVPLATLVARPFKVFQRNHAARPHLARQG